MMKDDLTFSGNTRFYKKSCYICGLKNHSENNCNSLNYYPNKIRLVYKQY